MPSAETDFRSTAPIANLRVRGELLRKAREFFDSRGFLEVETPLVSADTVVDRHLDPIPVTLADDPRRPDIGRRMWLQTSPEFGMKRLLAAGLDAIYQITRAFRNAEIGPLHNPEFTMVEWYRAGDGMRDGMQLLSDLCETLLGRGPAEMLSYAQAFGRFRDRSAYCHNQRTASRARGTGLNRRPDSADRDGWLDLLFVERCNRPWAACGRRSCSTTRRAKRHLRKCAPAIRRSPSGSSYIRWNRASQRLSRAIGSGGAPRADRRSQRPTGRRRQTAAPVRKRAARRDGFRIAAVHGRGPRIRSARDDRRRRQNSLAEVMAVTIDRA